MKSGVTFREWWNGVQTSCLCPEFRRNSTCFLPSPLLSCCQRQQKGWAAISGGPAARRCHGADGTLARSAAGRAARTPDCRVPFQPLGNQPACWGWEGGAHTHFQILELCGFQAHPGKDSHAWPHRANKSSNRCMFINPLGAFLSWMHNNSYRGSQEGDAF